ncbi:hypothetical protein LINPERHAP2_LOCUS15679 [Linum perenne]
MMVTILTSDQSTTHQHAALVLEFRELCSRHWEVSLIHVYHESNYSVDYLANLGHSLSIGLHLFYFHDSVLSSRMKYTLWQCQRRFLSITRGFLVFSQKNYYYFTNISESIDFVFLL